jgi:MFS transporter, FLVCR family, MFS-domain-containing protein 7
MHGSHSLRPTYRLRSAYTAQCVLVLLSVLRAPNLNVAYAGSKKSPPFISLLRAWVGKEGPSDAFMTKRERFDFMILTLIFGVLAAYVQNL